MSRARISVRAEVDWTAQDTSSAVLLVRAAQAPDQEIVEETLVVEGARVEEGPVLGDGARPVRLHAPAGPVRLRYRALVDVEQDGRAAIADERPLLSASQLPFALLPWTLPSRYAPSDLLGATAQAELGLGPRARALLDPRLQLDRVVDGEADQDRHHPHRRHRQRGADQRQRAEGDRHRGQRDDQRQ